MFRFLKNSAPFYFLWVSFIVFVFILKYYFSPYEIFLSINHFGHKNLDTFFTYYTYLGTPTAMIPIMIGAYLFTNQYHKKGFLIVSIISSLVLVLAIFFAKELYAYPRPYSHPF